MPKKIHSLKCWPNFFTDVIAGVKPFELRKNDRDFQVGEFIWLQEFNPDPHPKEYGYTGRAAEFEITYVQDDFPGLIEGYVVLGLKPSRYGR